jgi:hypothetical protein
MLINTPFERHNVPVNPDGCILKCTMRDVLCFSDVLSPWDTVVFGALEENIEKFI